ncbi:Peptidase A24 N-terminal domain-containing protein [Oscillospiraceae bacterium]|nr:Peptidase A24 N-terminal domain-containing protein [Oscillospiraceae bacterium]
MNVYTFLHVYYAVFSLLFGIVLGSFLNVVIYRLPAGRTISKGRSNCMTCGHTLAAKDLVPLFSWLFLRGKCRYCGAPIASRYAKIESLTGVVFFLTSITTLDAIVCVVNREMIYFLYLIYAVLFMIVMCTVIPAMMIWHDTTKGFVQLAGISLALSAIACVIAQVISASSDYVMAIVRFLIVIAAFPLLTWIGSKLFKTAYTKNDLFMDLTFAGATTFEHLLCPKSFSFWVFLFPVVYCIVRSALKGKKNDKFAGIIYFVIMIAAITISYIYRLATV